MAEKDYKTLYNTLFENNRDAIIFFNKTKIVSANKAALDLFEVNQEDFIGHHIYEFTKDKEIALKRIENRLKGEHEFYTSQIQTKRGIKEIEVSSTPVNLKDITNYSFVRDITERTNTERKYKTIFERSADLILVTNESGIVFINPKGLEYLEIDDEKDIIGKSTLNFIHPEYRALADRYAAERRAGGTPPSKYAVQLVTKKGNIREAEFNASYIEWDGVPSSLTIVRDIEKQIKYDEKLEALHSLAADLLLQQDINKIADKVIRAADEILGYKRISFSILEGNVLRVLAVRPTWALREFPLDGPGIMVRAIKTGTPQLVKDIRLDEDYVSGKKENETETSSEYAIPFFVRGKPAGVLNLESEKVDDFSDEDIKLVTILIDHINTTLEKYRYQRQLEALHEHSYKLSESKTREEVAQVTMEIINEVMGFRVSSFGFIQDDKVLFSEYTKDSNTFELPLNGKGITIRAITSGETQLVNDTRMDPDHVHGDIVDNRPSLSELDVPVKVEGKVVAVINAENTEANAFHLEDQRLIETLAQHIASRLKNIEYQRKIELIHQHTITLNKITDTQEALLTTYNTMRNELGYPVADIIKVEEDRILDAITQIDRGFSIPLDTPSITTEAAKTGVTQLINDTSKTPEYIASPEGIQYHSELVVPVFQDEKIAYLLNIEAPERNAFTEEDKHLVEMLGVVLGQALSKIQRMEYLEAIVKERTSDLIEANYRLEKLSEMKTRFVSTATHELRTPLTVMKGYLELSMESGEMEVIKEYLEVVFRNTQRFEILVNDLIDQQRIEEGRLTIKRREFKLGEMMTSTIEEMKPLVNARKQELRLILPDEDFMVYWDEARILQVMINLLSNASKYSPENTVITVEVVHQGEMVTVSVKDEGYGFTDEEITKIFTPFPDLNRPVLTERSIGLGLSICMGIISLHEGKIWAESQGRDKGSTFKFSIPEDNQ